MRLLVSDVNKAVVALALITLSVASVFTGSFAYLVLVNPTRQQSFSQTASSTELVPSASSVIPDEENSSSSASQSPPVSFQPTPATTPAPTPLADPSYPEGLEGWLPLGTFGVLSPANQTYTTNTITLSVCGNILVANPYMSYSLDGAPRKPIAIDVKKPAGLEVTMQRQISGSVVLPPLANGAHVIVLFADLGLEGRKGKEMVYFKVEAG